MNRRSSGSMSLKKAIVGVVNHKLAEGLSTCSVDSYERILQKWIERTGDREISEVTTQEIKSYLAWLRTDYKPIRFNGKTHPLSPKTIRNVGLRWRHFSSGEVWSSRSLIQ